MFSNIFVQIVFQIITIKKKMQSCIAFLDPLMGPGQYGSSPSRRKVELRPFDMSDEGLSRLQVHVVKIKVWGKGSSCECQNLTRGFILVAYMPFLLVFTTLYCVPEEITLVATKFWNKCKQNEMNCNAVH